MVPGGAFRITVAISSFIACFAYSTPCSSTDKYNPASPYLIGSHCALIDNFIWYIVCESQNSFPHLRPRVKTTSQDRTINPSIFISQRFPTTRLRAVIIPRLYLPMFPGDNLV